MITSHPFLETQEENASHTALETHEPDAFVPDSNIGGIYFPVNRRRY